METQKKIGHLDEPSSNGELQKTGRPLPTDPQPKIGHLEEADPYPKPTGGPQPERVVERGWTGVDDDGITVEQIKPDGKIDGGY